MTGWNLEHSYSELPQLFFSHQRPTPVRLPEIVVLNELVGLHLGLNIDALRVPDGAAALSGNKLPPGAIPIAQAYAGHQYGHFTMLGDGRAILLGEQITPAGQRFDIQLKGAGKTPYSRRGDGRAALGPMLREYIISEAMYELGIPTTRSLAVVKTGETVWRETALTGAVLVRVAESHLRVGTFQFAAQYGHRADLAALADYALHRHYPQVDGSEDRYLLLLREVIARQAALIARWQTVGFVHGVMNTDNTAISGETIDYGPCAFMDTYDPATVFSSIDHHGRYAYGNQPNIALWNLARFAEALLPLLHQDRGKAVELAQAELSHGAELFKLRWLAAMRAKLGLSNEEPEDKALITQLLAMMQSSGADFTNLFLALTVGELDSLALAETSGFAGWRERWQLRQERQTGGTSEAERVMQGANPAVIPRNHRVEEALEAACQGDLGVMERLLRVLRTSYGHAPEHADYSKPSGKPCRTFCGT
ncbi:MAG: hypothetical protein DDT39_00821 [Firmicutes bacterium]|nr:hypothetical protein [candidate division NPL-UPA2 bacterium]